jgi:hypothetical protein
MPQQTCPSEQELEAFQLGDLPEPGIDQVARHLEACPDCEGRARRLDTAVDAIGAAIRKPPASNWDTCLPDPSFLARRPAAVDVADFYPLLHPPEQPDEIGRLAGYRVLRLLGRGGMGLVFLAEDVTLHRRVALKVMRPDLNRGASGWQRFLREARIMAAVEHDHLATVFQAGQEGGIVYLAMELLEGESSIR